MKKERNELLSSADKGCWESKGVLAFLFRSMLKELRIGPSEWQNLMNRWLNDPTNGVPDNPKDRSTSRGNLDKALTNDAMTYLMFNKGVRFLSYLLSYVRIEVHFGDDRGREYKIDATLFRRQSKSSRKIRSVRSDE